MILIDQNSAINSLNEALVPNPHLIDGRTEQDWLYFLTEFSKLINFYNDSNTIDGNWSPFLLKDPVFLTASISKTNYKKLYVDYKNGCLEIQNLILKKVLIPNSRALNNLFDRITAIYQIIERWTHYMQSNSEIYDLKTYMLQEVKTRLSIDFWAIQSYRQYLYKLNVDGLFIMSAPFEEFKSFDKNIWYINKDKIPFWQVFGFEKEHPILQETKSVLITSLDILTKIGDKLFQFLETIIHHASKEFKKLNLKKGHFPDTVLLRSFVNILKIQQEQLNGLSEKHLDFYYQNILKQTKLPAVADQTFLCATLTKPTSVYTLPKGTLFNAGVDANKNPILFASQKNATLNPATIASVHKLSYQNKNNASYNLQTIVKPTEIQLDAENKAISWETFGSDDLSLTPSLIGIGFASPMLLLREGKRKITLTLEFDSPIDLQILQKANYFLSTQKDWLKLDLVPSNFTIDATRQNIVTIVINLDATVAAIEPFLVNPDGLKSDWPMMKVLFQNVPNPQNPPKVISITIALKVTGMKTFQLYNDYGELSTKNPFPPFGPIPLVNANFIIGNNEILSKPLDSFIVEIDWDKRPNDFSVYYKEYNLYLNPPPKKTSLIEEIEEGIKHIFFPKEEEKIIVPEFSNASFMVDFNIMKNKSWQNVKMSKITSSEVDKVFVPKDLIPKPLYLFDLETGDPSKPILNASSSYYLYCKPDSTLNTIASPKIPKIWKPDPNIQKEVLKFTEESSSGFVKMTLSSPEYGFGSELYTNVVASIALQNGNKLAMAKDQEVTDFIAAANVPFVPKIQGFSAIYNASVTYKLDGTAGDYPLQYFIYAPFSNYTVFDSATADKTETNLFSTEIVGSSENGAVKGFPLYPSFNYNGALFIELDNLICNSTLNLYFELARNSTALTNQNSISYYYLSESGWKNIQPLSDQTNQFRCSGIIEIPIPADCNNDNTIMPGTKNWISIAAIGNLASFSKTTFMQTNGFSVQRTGTAFLTDTESPHIDANTITKPENKIPEIGTILQPFASFGGKAAEDKTDRNKRVSNSIKTKNRASTPSDYYTLIAEKFNTIYYSKVVTKKNDNSTNVYLIRKIASDNDSNAFIPLVTNALEIQVQKFLSANSSPFINLKVSNFNLEYVCINITIQVDPNYQTTLVSKNVNLALKKYLSPWISNCPSEIAIGKPLVDAKVSTFIQNIKGVLTVENVTFSSYYIDPVTGAQTTIKSEKETLMPYGSTTLLVSAPNHNISYLI
ncbi:baseplate J/gp47 family protein [Flavobacterium sp. GN10]|uniref:Baseplate J/gp47 family protein n=1 Tax=Flavobacterium tagetis TaxID=2801336 RepID=A0ABS1KJB9_9FLAO|nr:baseplate J/gp47 family protein [Flavobacterium tagetis]MBL0739541.1 baseplate J/gp47 family protein [Flavobacterium tagetis]